MQFKVYKGSFVFIILFLLAIVFFMLPAILVFAMIATAVSIIVGIINLVFGKKQKQQAIPKSTEGATIDVAAEIE